MKPKIIFVFTALLFVLKISAQPVPSYVSTSVLKGYWPLTGNANDISGNAFNGVVTGAVLTADRFGTTNNAYSFNGTSAYILTSYMGIMGGGARAISFWAAVDTSQGQDMEAIGWGVENPGERFSCSFNRINGNFFPSTSAANCISGFIPTAPIIPTAWHHYVYQLSGTTIGQVQIYQDAVLMTNPTNSQNVALNTIVNTGMGNNVTFGRIWIPNVAAFYKGRMDDIGIWERVLTQCEISKLYYADTNIGSMSFNPAGYSGSVMNLAQFTQTLSGSSQFSVAIAASVFSGTGVSFSGGQYNFNSPPTLAPGIYTITHTYTLQGGCVQASTNMVSLNSATGFSSISNLEKPGVEIFPNPAHSQLGIFSNVENENLDLSIMDMAGKIVVHTSILSNKQDAVDLSPLENGLYLVEIRDNENNRTYKKLIISR